MSKIEITDVQPAVRTPLQKQEHLLQSPQTRDVLFILM